MNNASLIVTRKPVAPATTRRPCACARVAKYGTMCRWCAWRLLTPPPLHGTPDPVDRHSLCPQRCAAGIADVTTSKTPGPGELCAYQKAQIRKAEAKKAARKAARADRATNLRD